MDCYQRREANPNTGEKASLVVHKPAPDAREIIVFPGIDGAQNWPGPDHGRAALSGLLKLVRFAVDEPGKPPVAIAGIIYPFMRQEEVTQLDAAEEFVRTQLMPRLGLSEQSAANQPPAEAVAAALARITFVTHSYGGKFAQDVAVVLKKRLEEQAYRPHEIEYILGCGMVLATAGHTAVDSEPQFPTFFFRGVNDPVPAGGPTWQGKPAEMILEKAGYGGPTQLRCRWLPQGMLITAAVNETLTALEPGATQLQTWRQKHYPHPPRDAQEAHSRRIMDSRHSPRNFWLAPAQGSHPEFDTGGFIELKRHILHNALNRAPSAAIEAMLDGVDPRLLSASLTPCTQVKNPQLSASGRPLVIDPNYGGRRHELKRA